MEEQQEFKQIAWYMFVGICIVLTTGYVLWQVMQFTK